MTSHIPNIFVSDAHSVITALIFSIVIHVVALPWTISIGNQIVGFVADVKAVAPENPIEMNWAVFRWLIFVLFVLPVIIALVLSSLWGAQWTQRFLGRVGLSLAQRTPKAWDWFFITQKQGCWVIAEFEDGTLVGGEYGKDSFASLSPNQEDLYLESCYYVDENHNFFNPVPDNVGTWINGEKVKKLHFYRASSGEADESAKNH